MLDRKQRIERIILDLYVESWSLYCVPTTIPYFPYVR